MNDNWIEEKAREVLKKIKSYPDVKSIAMNVQRDHDRQAIAAALREAENRGLEKAAEVCESQRLNYIKTRAPIRAEAAGVSAISIRALKTGEGR